MKHASGYRAYAREQKLLPHRAIADWRHDGRWYCVCAYPVMTTRITNSRPSPATRHRQQPAPGSAVRTD